MDSRELENRINNWIKESIEEIVKEEYQKVGYYGVKPNVGITFQENISVYINTEVPFVSNNQVFWEMVERIKARIFEVIKNFGYVPVMKTKFFYDFLVLRYEFKIS